MWIWRGERKTTCLIEGAHCKASVSCPLLLTLTSRDVGRILDKIWLACGSGDLTVTLILKKKVKVFDNSNDETPAKPDH